MPSDPYETTLWGAGGGFHAIMHSGLVQSTPVFLRYELEEILCCCLVSLEVPWGPPPGLQREACVFPPLMFLSTPAFPIHELQGNLYRNPSSGTFEDLPSPTTG